MSKAGAGKFLVAIILASFASTGTAFAQSQVVQSAAKEQARSQSTNQIVGAADQKAVDPKPTTAPQNIESPKPAPQVQISVENAVIPPPAGHRQTEHQLDSDTCRRRRYRFERESCFEV